MMNQILEEKVNHSKALIREHHDEPSAIAFSGGKDSTVIAHLVRETLNQHITLLFLDHGRHFLEVRAFASSFPYVYWMETEEEWEPDPEVCCANIKIELIKQAIEELYLDTLYVGIRRDEHPARDTSYTEMKGCKRVYPILDWTEQDVWLYIKKNGLRVVSLYDQGYRSIGCTNCSSPGGEQERSGRGKKEEMMSKLRKLGYF